MPCLPIVDTVIIRLKKSLNIRTVDHKNDARTAKSLTSILRIDLENLISKLNENVKYCAYMDTYELKKKCLEGFYAILLTAFFSKILKESHFIRCVKANNRREPNFFDDDVIKTQLRANSMVPYLRLIRFGYPTRKSFDQLLLKFDNCLTTSMKSLLEATKRKLCKYILLAIGYNMSDFKLGETCVCFRPGKDALFDQFKQSSIKDVILKIESQSTHDKWGSVVEEVKIRECKMEYKLINIEIGSQIENHQNDFGQPREEVEVAVYQEESAGMFLYIRTKSYT